MSGWPKQHLHEVAEGITACVQGRGEMGVSNASFVLEQGRACVIDTLTFPAMAQHMAAEIKQRGARVDLVINTHHHIDHIGGNAVFAEAQIFAHPTARHIMQAVGHPVALYDRLMPAFKGRFAAQPQVLPEPLPPDLRIPQAGELLTFHAAHTPVDLAVWFPGPRVLLAGDLAFFGVVPLAIHGLISGWVEALSHLLALQPVTVVPGHGYIGTADDLRIMRDFLAAALQLARKAHATNLSLQEALTLFDPGPVGDWLEAGRIRLILERALQEARGELDREHLIILPGGEKNHATG
ncbi:putative sulfatase/cyclase [Thermosporothrix hazakensis]|jgi:glyoxylase-like metal-dependent hydrolase (beta-lactamase superfamily II)|uniref:Putative sulfatase/cyclase n=1 Tax=Thermosporothrix hazakensis TaxID=644383 RepID=A0A326U041_THEHA|nr:MBL fold metallo-hydrolase [Thermosporothrix hazakensis]PZW18310.1 putative sulfatase/cyclase [Thermosporothrix hazakensis]GCE51436.1 MBL fold metallo-hydrolase [Thermosporothrix hazakensis]